MADIFNNISDFFTGNSKASQNPDIQHNIFLLGETKKKIETGVFTKFFKKPTIIAGELVAYASTVLLILIGIYFWSKIDSLLGVIQASAYVHNIFSEAKWDTTIISIINVLLLFISAMPGFICFLLGRSLTKSRKKINTFIEVENMIDRVIYNLKGVENS